MAKTQVEAGGACGAGGWVRTHLEVEKEGDILQFNSSFIYHNTPLRQ